MEDNPKLISTKNSFLVEMKHQKGGERWRQGADGCIFKPPVACQSESGAISFNPSTNTVSKIMPKGSVDERVEEIIEKHFPHVVARKGVLIAKKRCTPLFISRNLPFNPSINQSNSTLPCMSINTNKPQKYTNFVLEEYGSDFKRAFGNSGVDDILVYIQNALNAAVALVPDNGPWILGFDFHLGNILVKREGNEIISSLADWGRTIIVENPNDPVSLQKGINDALDNLRTKGGWTSEIQLANGTTKIVPLINFRSYPDVEQFINAVRSAIDDVNSNPLINGNINPKVHLMRLTTIYGILMSLLTLNSFKAPRITDRLYDIIGSLEIEARSQADIVRIINKYIKGKLFPNGFINLNMFPPVPTTATNQSTNQSTTTTTTTTAATATTSAVGAGAGTGTGTTIPPTPEGYSYMGGRRKRTRKHKHKHKQKRKNKQSRRL